MYQGDSPDTSPTLSSSDTPRHLGTPPRPPPRRSPTPSTTPVSPSYSHNLSSFSSSTPPHSNTPPPHSSNTPPRSGTPIISYTPPRSGTPIISYTPPQCTTPRSLTPHPGGDSGLGTESGGLTSGLSALPAYLSPSGQNSKSSSRRTSLAADMIESRRESMNKMATDVFKDVRKGVKNVSDNTKKAGHKVKDRTAMAGKSVKGASHWVALHTSKSAKQAMMQARSGLSIGEKTTLFLTEKISAWSRKGFTHVFMFLMIAAYTALGAVLFIAIEGPHETTEKLLISSERDRLIADLYVESRLHGKEDWSQMAKERLRPFEDQLYSSFKHGISADTDTKVWTFWKSMFFCSTITTTIGYGHMSPVTTAGQTLCIIYAIIGIPLMLILLADFGKLFTRILRTIFRLIFRINRSVCCLKFKSSSAVVGCQSAFKSICSIIFFCGCCKKKEDKSVESGGAGDDGEVSAKAKAEEITLEQLIQGDDFNLPISLALLILIIYIILGCVVFPLWEEWTFFEAFYFIFISISTIGFGDYVPQNPAFMMASTVYFIFGLALTAMCINIIQETLTNTFREATLKMKESFSHIMAKAEQEAEEAARKRAAETEEEVAEVHKGVSPTKNVE